MKKLLLFFLLLPLVSAQTNFSRMLSGVNYVDSNSYQFTSLDVTRPTVFRASGTVVAALPNGNNLFFGAGSIFTVIMQGSGTLVISCSGCTIAAGGTVGSTLTLTTGQGADIYGDGLNFTANIGAGSGGGGGGGSSAWASLTSGNNNSGTFSLDTGASLFPINNGLLRANSLVPGTFSQTAPGSVDWTGCSAQTSPLNPFAYVPLANGHFAEWACMDMNINTPPTAPAGTPEFTWRTWWNSSKLPLPGGKNRFVAIYHTPGMGGVDSNGGANDESAFSVQMSNTGTEQTFRQLIAQYNEVQLNGTPTFAGHAFGEDDASAGRFNLTDNRTGGTTAIHLSALTGIYFRNTTAGVLTSCANGGCANGVEGGVFNLTSGSAGAAVVFFSAIDGIGSDNGGCTNCGYVSMYAHPPINPFASGNFGFAVDSFGTAATSYNIFSGGVNSAGTAAGFNTFTGPSAFGTSVHAATGFQLDILGSVKLKAAAGANDICFFGSTSGSVCFTAAAAAGTPPTFTWPTSDGSNGYSLVTDGAGHLSFANITGGGGGCSGTCITSINSQTGPILTLNVNNVGTNVALSIANPSANVLQFSAALAGRIPPANLDTTVFVNCSTTTKISCTPGTQAFALALSSVWAATDLNANVVQAVTNDSNVCASIGSGPTAQTLILGWLGSTGCNSGTPVPLTVARGGNGLGSFANNQILVGTAANVFTATTLTNGILSYNTTTHLFSTASALSNPMTTLGDMIYSSDGSGTAARLAAPTTPNGVAYTLCSTPSGGVGAAPAWCLGGVTGRTYAGSTSDPIVATDRTAWVVYTNNSSTVPVPLPAAGTTGFASNYSYRAIVQGSSPVTVTPAAGTINGGSTFTMNQGENCLISTLDNTNYTTACSPGQLIAGTGIGFTRSASGLTITASSVGTPSDVTNQSTSQTAVTIGTSLPSGRYTIKYYANLNTACSTGGNSVSFTFNWTDAGSARSLTTGNLSLAAGSPALSAYLEGQFTIFVASSNVTYTSTISGACATGTSTYDVHVAVAP